MEFYKTAMDGVRGYHSSVLGGIEINNSKIAPPPAMSVNGDNINHMLYALLQAYREQDSTDEKIKNPLPYKSLKGAHGKIYSISNDGIQKFRRELNGSFVRTVGEEIKAVNVPWALTEIEGGSLNAVKLYDHLLRIISNVHPIPNNAWDMYLRNMIIHISLL